MEGGKEPLRKEMGYRVFPDINRIGRPKAVTSIPILLGYYRSLHDFFGCAILQRNDPC